MTSISQSRFECHSSAVLILSEPQKEAGLSLSIALFWQSPCSLASAEPGDPGQGYCVHAMARAMGFMTYKMKTVTGLKQASPSESLDNAVQDLDALLADVRQVHGLNCESLQSGLASSDSDDAV